MPEHDPEKLSEVDREIRINELKEQAREMTDGEMESFEHEDAPPEIIEQFWEHVIETERSPWTTNRQQLQQDGVALPPSQELTDTQVAAKLEEIFARLAARRTFFLNTNHLIDRELYEVLLCDTLNEEFPDAPIFSSEGVHIVDMVSSGSEEDIQAWLRYYADDEERRQWQAEWPDDPMPPRETPPCDRDRHLPPLPEGY